MEWLFILGVAWMIRSGWEKGRPARNQRRIAAAARPGVNHARHKARARRQATAGWWLTEIFRGLPVTREGFRDGWAEHQQHLARRRHENRQRDHAHRRQRDEWLDHWRDLIAAERERRQEQESEPPIPGHLTQQAIQDRLQRAWDGEDDPHMRGENCTDPNCRCHENDPPLADGTTPGAGPVNQNGRSPSTNGHQPRTGATTMSDGGAELNFDEVNDRCDKAVQQAENIATADLSACESLPDDLGGVPKIRENADLMGKAHELGSAVRDLERARTRVLEAAQAVKDQNTQDYGGQQEAADASGKATSEYVEH